MLLDILDVLDEASNLIIPCAVILDRNDALDVKPISQDLFPASPLSDLESTPFDLGWWRVSKKDLSAQPSKEKFDTDTLSERVWNRFLREVYLNPEYQEYIPKHYLPKIKLAALVKIKPQDQ